MARPALAEYLHTNGIRAVVDATHPFAANMSASPAAACDAVGVPLLRLARPGWSSRPDARSWWWVDSTAAAADAARRAGERAFLTTGRQTLADFTGLAGRRTMVRMVEPPPTALPGQWQVILDRGPYALSGELSLMRAHEVDVLVTKDSGGSYTAAKLDAAAELRIPVVVVRRPASVLRVPTVDSVSEALDWVRGLERPTSG